MQKPKFALIGGRQFLKIAAYGLKQVKGSDNICLNKVAGAQDGSVNMALGCKVDDGADLMCSEKPPNQIPVGNVTIDKEVPAIGCNRRQILHVSSVGQLIEIEDRLVICRQPVENKITADKAGAACYQNHSGLNVNL